MFTFSHSEMQANNIYQKLEISKSKHTASTRNVESSLRMRRDKFRWQKLFLQAKTILPGRLFPWKNRFSIQNLPTLSLLIYYTVQQ